MNAGAQVSGDSAMMERGRSPTMSVSIIKRSWRERLGGWIAGVKPSPIMLADPRNMATDYDMAEKKAITNGIEGGMRFRIVPATNGKVIAYTVQTDSERIGRIGEQFYVVKEGDSLLDSIATCLSLDRLKS